jgi:LL-diaminopimelate aminotransferase
MAISALNSDNSVISQNIEIYKTRRDRLISALELFGLKVTAPKAGLYLWIKVPEGHDSSSFTEFLLDKLDIVVTPGNGFGDSGEGYFRISLTTPDKDIEKAIERLESINLNN